MGKKQIVLCCDGTNNTLTAGYEDTNVVRLYEHLNAHPPTGDLRRVLYYDPGVGTGDTLPPTDLFDWALRSLHRASGLATGRGVYENIEAAYLFLMRQFESADDEIYLFGFSRGAFTARCVAGMVNLFGVLRPEHESLVPTLVRIYFSPPESRDTFWQRLARSTHQATASSSHKASIEIGGHPPQPWATRQALADQVRAQFTGTAGRQAWVHWVGVWDTVESVGLPGPLARKNPSTAAIGGKRMRHVRHALSLDDHRWTFMPRLYDEPTEQPTAGQTCLQRWFPGAHCDAGGSYPASESGIADAALRWMVKEVAAHLQVPPLPASDAALVLHDPLWDTPWWALAGMTTRDMRPVVQSAQHQGAPIPVVPAELDARAAASVWSLRRPLRWLVLSAVLGLLFLVLSGFALMEPGARQFRLGTLLLSLQLPSQLAWEQLASLWGGGLLQAGHAPWQWPGQVGWSLFWDFLFIAAWGYWLARIASRAFHGLVGRTRPGAPPPRAAWLGFAPLAAVGGDVVENLLTLAALGAHGLGTDFAATVLLPFVGLAALAKFAGLLACVPLVLLRAWLVFRPEARPPAGGPLPLADDSRFQEVRE